MKILAVGDVHCASNLEQVEKLIVAEDPHLTVFLGDYFDGGGDSPSDNERTAKWLHGSLTKPKRIHLLGNHDLQYSHRRTGNYAHGFSLAKYGAIWPILREADWARLKLFHWEGDWLFTHAGWSRHHCPDKMRPGKMASFLARETQISDSTRIPPRPSWVFGVGKSRGGLLLAGGLLWCDPCEFEGIPGLNQVFGHTRGAAANLSARPGQGWVIDSGTQGGVRSVLRIEDRAVSLLDVPKSSPATVNVKSLPKPVALR